MNSPQRQEDSLTVKLAERFPREFSQGLDIGLSVLEDITGAGEINDDSLGAAYTMAAHRVASQTVSEDEAGSVATCVTLFGADNVIQEFFHKQELTV